MEQMSIAIQRAMAAEIRSRLGYMNRTQKWLQDQADVRSSTWRKYFTEGAITREVPMPTVQRIAAVLGMTTGELVTIAEINAPEFIADLPGISEQERDDLRRAIERNAPRKRRPGDGQGDQRSGTNG